MVQISISYQGNLRCESIHEPSGTSLLTDAPKDNQGQGASFSPTDLVATALGSCILTTMAIIAKNLNVDLTGSKVTVNKEMTPPPRRIGKLSVLIEVATKLDEAQKQKLIHAAEHCPVHKSMHPDVLMPIEYRWE